MPTTRHAARSTARDGKPAGGRFKAGAGQQAKAAAAPAEGLEAGVAAADSALPSSWGLDEHYDTFHSPVHAAVSAGDAAVLRRALDAGCDPDDQGPMRHVPVSDRPIHTAAQNGSHEMVSLLLAAGADPNIGGSDCGQTALDSAVRSGDMASVELLVDRCVPSESTYTVTDADAMKCLDRLLYTHPAETAARALELRVSDRHPNHVRMFLQHGVPLTPNAVWSATCSTPEILRMVIDAGGDLSTAEPPTTHGGWKMLAHCAAVCDQDMLRALIGHMQPTQDEIQQAMYAAKTYRNHANEALLSGYIDQ